MGIKCYYDETRKLWIIKGSYGFWKAYSTKEEMEANKHDAWLEFNEYIAIVARCLRSS